MHLRAWSGILVAASVLAWAASPALGLEPSSYAHDRADPQDDVRFFPDAGGSQPAQRPGLDLLRLETLLIGEDLVQVATLLEPLEDRATLYFDAQLDGDDTRKLVVTFVKDASLPDGHQTEALVLDAGDSTPIGATGSEEGTTVTVVLAVSGLPAWVACFLPSATSELYPDQSFDLYRDVLPPPSQPCVPPSSPPPSPPPTPPPQPGPGSSPPPSSPPPSPGPSPSPPNGLPPIGQEPGDEPPPSTSPGNGTSYPATPPASGPPPGSNPQGPPTNGSSDSGDDSGPGKESGSGSGPSRTPWSAALGLVALALAGRLTRRRR